MPDQIQEVRELQTGLVMVAAGVGACIVPHRCAATAAATCLHRHHRSRSPRLDDAFPQGRCSPELRMLLTLFAQLYAEWGWPVPTELARINASAQS